MTLARFVTLAAVALAAFPFSAEVGAQGKSKVQPVRMTITAVPGARVTGDAFGATYTDYRAAMAPDTCVEVTADLVFVRFNRHYPDSSTSNFQYCERANDGQFASLKRQFWLEIHNPVACAELVEAAVASDNPFAFWVDDTLSVCRVNGSDKPRLGAGEAFKARLGKRVSVTFLILSYDNSSVAYEVQTSALVEPTSTASRRILTNAGSTATRAVLIKNSGQVGVPNTTIGDFDLPFGLEFEKVM
jgi:hypothetical protein